MKENLPHLVKEIGIHVQEVQRVSKQDECKRPTPKYIIIKMPKIKEKERLLKAAREREAVSSLQGSSHKTVS